MANKIQNKIVFRRKAVHIAVSAALPFVLLGANAYAAGSCTSSNGVVNCTGAFTGGASGGAIMVVPSNYTAVSNDATGNTEALGTTIVGFSNANDFSIANIGSMNLSVPKFSALNIGSGSTSPAIGIAPDSTTTVVTGLKAVPGYVDVFNGGTAPTHGDSVATQLTHQAGAKPLVNFEGVDIQQAGTVNNFGTITNTTAGSASTPLATNTFLVTNGPKVFTEGGADNLPYRTLGVWLNGDSTKLNNYGVITAGVNDSAITSSSPGVTGPNASLYTSLLGGGTAFNTTFNPDGSVNVVTLGPSKPTVYAVLGTSDSDDFYGNVNINNYNKIGAYLFVSNRNNSGTPVAIELKENLLDAHVYNAPGAIIEGVASSTIFVAASHSSLGTTWAPGVGKETYTKALGGANAIGTDNNSDLITVINDGIIQSMSNAATPLYGTALNLSNARSVITNNVGGRIFGDISVSNQSNEFTFQNAGILTGNIVVTPNAGNGTGTSGSLVPTAQADGSIADVATARNVTNKVVIQPVINSAGGGNTVAAVGQITGGVYIASGGAASGGHPFELDVQPLVASGVTVKTGNTYTYSGNNINIATGAKATPNNADGTAGTTTQINNTNVQILSTALVNWAFVPGTTNQIVATVADPSTINGLSANGKVVLTTLLASSGPVSSLLQNLSDPNDVVKATEQLRPEINGASIQAALSATNKVFGVVDAHLDEVHVAQLTGNSGIATGDQTNGLGIWMQGFGFRGDQDLRKSVNGYNADAYGFAAGADKLLNDDTRVGIAVSYAQSNINDKGASTGNTNDIDSYQATLYGSMLIKDALIRNWYLNGMLGLSRHDYSSKRIVIGNIVSGDHEAMQYTAKVEAGLPLKVGKTTITPIASLTYSRLSEDGYTESGVGALVVGNQETDSFRTGLGAKAQIPLYDKASLNSGLELRAIWGHEFADTAQDTTASFASGGSSFTTSGVSPARDSADLGVSIRIASSEGYIKQSLSVSYDAEIKDEYLSHTAQLQARFDF